MGVSFSAGGKDAIAAFGAVAESAIATGVQIETAFKAALGKVATLDEARTLGALLESAGRQGKVGFDAAARSAAALNARIREIQVAIDPLADEFARLGIQSQASLNATRDAAKSAFDAIRDGAARGKASVEDVRRAFRAYADATRAAAADSDQWRRDNVDSQLAVQESIYDTERSMQRLGDVSDVAMRQLQDGASRSRERLLGKPGQGTGTINYQTGSVVVTAGALPDLKSSIISNWGTPIIAEARVGDTAILPPALRFVLGEGSAVPGTVQLTLRVGGANVAVTDNGNGGLLIGGQVRGQISYSTGEVSLRPLNLPDADSQLSIAYDWGLPLHAAPQPVPDAAGIVSFTLPQDPVRQGTVLLDWLVSVRRDRDDLSSAPQAMRVIAKDDGTGNLVGVSVGDTAFSTVLGAVNYSTGAVSLQAGSSWSARFPIRCTRSAPGV